MAIIKAQPFSGDATRIQTKKHSKRTLTDHRKKAHSGTKAVDTQTLSAWPKQI